MAGAYAAVFTAVSVVKYRYYLYTDFDLAIFAQAMAQMLHGSFFNSIRGMNWLADHSSFTLFLLTPLYALFRSPLLLLVLQSLVLALAALPVYRLASRMLGDERLACVFVALYLLYPAVGYTNLFEFHPETFSTTTLLLAFDALLAGRVASTLLYGGLTLLAKEDAALAVFGLALCSVLRRPRQWITPVGLAGMAMSSLLLTFCWIKPRLGHGEQEYGLMFAHLGGTPTAVILNVATHPFEAIASFVRTPGDVTDTLVKREYYVQMLLPLLLLPILSPTLLAGAVPILAEYFLSSRSPQHAIVNQYTALVTPFFVVAAVGGTQNLLRWVRGSPEGMRALRTWLAIGILGASVTSNLLYGPLLGHQILQAHPAGERFWPNANDRALRPYRDRMVSRVPSEAGVVASFEYLPRLSSHANAQSFQHVYSGRYTLSKKPYPVPDGISALLTALGNQYSAPAMARVRELIQRNHLRPVDSAGDLLLFLGSAQDTLQVLALANNRPASEASILFDGALEFRGCDLQTLSVAPGELLSFRTYWSRRQTSDYTYLTRLWVYDQSDSAVFFQTRYLGYGVAPASSWPPDSLVRETYRIVVPPTLRPGNYALVMQVAHVSRAGSGVAVPNDPKLQEIGGYLSLGGFSVR